jgi:hypothetical protein
VSPSKIPLKRHLHRIKQNENWLRIFEYTRRQIDPITANKMAAEYGYAEEKGGTDIDENE